MELGATPFELNDVSAGHSRTAVMVSDQPTPGRSQTAKPQKIRYDNLCANWLWRRDSLRVVFKLFSNWYGKGLFSRHIVVRSQNARRPDA